MPGDGWEGDRGGGTAGLDPWRGGAEAWRRVLPPSTQRGGVPCPPPPGAKARRRRRGEGIPLIPAEAGGPRARPGVCTRALCVRTWACMQITCAKCAGLPPPRVCMCTRVCVQTPGFPPQVHACAPPPPHVCKGAHLSACACTHACAWEGCSAPGAWEQRGHTSPSLGGVVVVVVTVGWLGGGPWGHPGAGSEGGVARAVLQGCCSVSPASPALGTWEG